jgi:hypothetical protein
MIFQRISVVAVASMMLGCDSDPAGPSELELAVAAMRFDALGNERDTAGDIEGARGARSTAMALRLGARPSSVRLTIDGETADYLALVTEHSFRAGTMGGAPLPPPALAMRTLLAWQGLPPDRFVALTISADTGTFGRFFALQSTDEPASVHEWFMATGVVVDRGESPWFAVDGGARITQVSLGESCRVPRRHPAVTFEPIACRQTSFAARFTMVLGPGTILHASEAPSRMASLPLSTISGVWLEYPPLPTMCAVC